MAYSNTGWRLGQAVLEARTGRPYGAVLRERDGSVRVEPARFGAESGMLGGALLAREADG